LAALIISEETYPRLQFRLPLDAARLLRARQRIRDYLHGFGVTPIAIDDVVLAIQEAMTNAVRHSGAEDGLEVDVHIRGSDLAAIVRDHGRGCDTADFDRERVPSLDEPGGRGLYLIARLMDELELTGDQGLEVHMRKRNVFSGHDSTTVGFGTAVPGAQAHHDIRQRELLEEIEEGFFALDWEYRFIYINAAAERIWGKSRQHYLSRTIMETHRRLPGEVCRGLRKAMELGSSSLLEAQARPKGRWREYRAYPASFGVVAYMRDIDERKRKELERDQLRDSVVAKEAVLASTFEQTAIGVVHLAPDSTLLRLNERFGDLLGYPPEKLENSSLMALTHRRDRHLLRHRLEALVAGMYENLTYEQRLLHRSGATVWTSMTLSGVSNDDGEVRSIVALVQDIGGRKRTEEELLQQQAETQHLLRHAPVAIYEIGFRGPSFTMVNDVMCIYTGYTQEELLTMDPYALLDKEGAERFRKRIGCMLLGEEADPEVEYRFFTKQGDERYAVLNVIPTYQEGKPTGAFVVAHDVTDRRRAEDALRESERRYRELVEKASSAIIRYRRDGTITFFNEHAERLFGWPAREIEGQHIGLLVPERESSGADLTGLIDDIITQPERYEQHVNENVRRDGRRLSLAWTNQALRDERGAVVEILAVGTDVTERVRAEEELRRLYDAQQRIATTLQQNFVHPLPHVPGLELASLSLPASQPELVGGDFHDVFRIADDKVIVLIGDVMGKGVQAAGLTETVRSAVRALGLVTGSPAKILDRVNRLLLSSETEQLVSVLVIVLNPVTRRGAFASAGHPPPIVKTRKAVKRLEPRYGLPLGAIERSYRTRQFTLDAGDTLILYTDGLTEARYNGELFGEQRLLETLDSTNVRSPEGIIEQLRRAVLAHDVRLQDDLEVLTLRFMPEE
jgi:PAS domain S-box-containing protein